MVWIAYWNSCSKIGKLDVYVDMVSTDLTFVAEINVRFHSGFHVAASTVTVAFARTINSVAN